MSQVVDEIAAADVELKTGAELTTGTAAVVLCASQGQSATSGPHEMMVEVEVWTTVEVRVLAVAITKLRPLRPARMIEVRIFARRT